MFFVEKNINNPYILILGRQHPPEVTGAFAMRGFINQLLNKNSLSDSFLKNYNILFVPLMNPDGVMNGYWRYNENKKDLNRDWGIFIQPETDSINKSLTEFLNKKLFFLIIFLSFSKHFFIIFHMLLSLSLILFLYYYLL